MHESIHDAFVEHFLATVKTFKAGDPMDATTYIGAITRAPQLDVLDAQVADALARAPRCAAVASAAPAPATAGTNPRCSPR